MLPTIFLSLPCLVLSSQESSAPKETSDSTLGVEVFEYLERLHEDGFAGIMLFVKGDERLLEEGFGLADRENETPWTTRTHSTIGSIAKQFTGTAILKLEEEGKLSVTDPLSRFIEEMPEDKEGITLHHLLTHSSGVQEFGKRDDHWVDRDELVYGVLEKPLRFAPGERYEYSNAGFSILAAVVEHVSGTDYETYLREKLFLPSGMKETGFRQPELESSRLAVGYRGDQRWGTMLEDMYFEDGPSWVLRGNGGIYSTAEDMFLWLRALSTGSVLTEDSMKKLWGRHVDETNGAAEYFYGYGWSLYDAPGGQAVVCHNGNDAGPTFFNDLMWIPEEQAFLFLQMNTYENYAHSILERIMERLTSGVPLPG